MIDGVYCFPLVTIESGLEKFKTDANNIISACVKEKRALPTLCHEVVSKEYTCNVFYANLYLVG